MMKSARHLRRSVGGAALACGLIAALLGVVGPAASAAVPAGFSDTAVITGRVNPTSVTFAANGQVLVTEKRGKIWAYNGLSDTKPTLMADLGTQVDNYWDRGLLGLAIPPNYPTDNHVYVLYTADAPIGGTAPKWNDTCPSPPGPTTDGCVVSGRLSRLTISGGVSTGEQVLVNAWCQQFPSHSIGALAFGSDGYLYASGGEGANFNATDYGQFGATNAGDKANPCGDPPGGVGVALTPPTAEGGSLRSQSMRRTDGPALLNGTVIRVDPATGLGASDNPFAGSTDVNKARVLAYGFRNPFRFTMRPGTRELWVGDVGASTWEEINRVSDTAGRVAANYGWPCYEGRAPQPGFQSAGLNQCTSLYSSGTAVGPYFTYKHSDVVAAGDNCSTTSGSSVTGLAFYPGGSYPSSYKGALFFADHSRKCMWAMLPGASGDPDPTKIVPFSPASGAVDVKVGPNNDIFYVDLGGGTIHRITYKTGNQPPVARMTATPASGALPLTVQFSGTGSTDPEGGALTYGWTFGDGTTGTGATVSHTYSQAGTYPATLKVTDPGGLSSSTTTTITAGSSPPTISSFQVKVTDRVSGATLTTYKVGDHVTFSGSAKSSTGSTLPPSAFSWHLLINHGTHTHDGGTISGKTSGFFSAPDHSYPCSLTVTLTVTDPGSHLTKTASKTVNPATVQLTFTTSPAGLKLGVDLAAATAPFKVTVVVGHATSVSATSPQTLNGKSYSWRSWSDGKPASHVIQAPKSATTYVATYHSP
jgi:glucose/arabinose dehydrogenase